MRGKGGPWGRRRYSMEVPHWRGRQGRRRGAAEAGHRGEGGGSWWWREARAQRQMRRARRWHGRVGSRGSCGVLATSRWGICLRRARGGGSGEGWVAEIGWGLGNDRTARYRSWQTHDRQTHRWGIQTSFLFSRSKQTSFVLLSSK